MYNLSYRSYNSIHKSYCKGHNCRNSPLESWVGSYLSREILRSCRRALLVQSMRFTAPFKAEELPFWIETLRQSCLEVHLENVSDPQVLQILANTQHFAVK